MVPLLAGQPSFLQLLIWHWHNLTNLLQILFGAVGLFIAHLGWYYVVARREYGFSPSVGVSCEKWFAISSSLGQPLSQNCFCDSWLNTANESASPKHQTKEALCITPHNACLPKAPSFFPKAWLFLQGMPHGTRLYSHCNLLCDWAASWRPCDVSYWVVPSLPQVLCSRDGLKVVKFRCSCHCSDVFSWRCLKFRQLCPGCPWMPPAWKCEDHLDFPHNAPLAGTALKSLKKRLGHQFLSKVRL